jgi:prephenate dehydratase
VSRVAYFGPEGTFTEMALLQCQRSAAAGETTVPGVDLATAERVSAPSQLAAVRLVGSGEADLACVPIESSVEGPVTPTVDALGFGPAMQIFAETSLPVAFVIAAAVPVERIRTVAAYPIAAAQVRESLERLLPDAEVVPAASNAAAALQVRDGHADAAVTTALAAGLADLPSVFTEVADVADARTRFVLVGRPGPVPPRTGSDCTSVILDVPSVPGALARAMAEYALRGIDLTRIESRPKRTELGKYLFHLDCVGHIDDPDVAATLGALHRLCDDVRFLGSWPRPDGSGTRPADPGDTEAWLDRQRRGDR